MTLTLVNLEKVRTFLLKKFEIEEITTIKLSPNPTVNDHVVFEIEKKKYIMKILTRKPAAEHEYYRLEKEANLLKQFGKPKNVSENKESNVPVPNIIHAESDTSLIGYKFIIMEFIEGDNLEDAWNSLEKDTKETAVLELADIIRSIHAIKYEMFGDIEEFDFPRKFYTYERLLKSNIRKYARIIGPKDLLPTELITKTVKFVEDNIEKIDLNIEPTLIHNDLHFGNFIIDKKGKIRAILDFEWAAAGHPFTDLFNLKSDFPLEEELRKKFFKRYFANEREDLDDYALLEKITTIIAVMSSVAVGWINFHPTKENLVYSKKKIEELLEE